LKTKPGHEMLYRWLLAIGCFALLVYFFSPPWAVFRAWSRAPELVGRVELRRGASVLWQADHPGMAIPDPLHGAIQWRLLFPVIGHLFHLPPAGLFGLADLGCVLVLVFVITVLRRRGVGWGEAALAAAILGAGSWYFASVRWLGYYDSWLMLGLLLVAFARTRWPVGLACLWAPWIDERFVIAAPLALVCRYVLRSRGDPAVTPANFWRQELAVPTGLIAAFLGFRLGVLSWRSMPNATIVGYLGSLHLRGTPWTRVVFGVWEGLRVAWFFVGAAVVLLRRNRGQAAFFGATVLAVMLVALGTAQDFSRSMMFILPAALLGLQLAFEAAPRWLPLALRVGAGAALLLPASLVMNDGVNPVAGLDRELAALRSPPPAIMSERYELRGIQGMEQGTYAQAEADLSLAIKLADHPASPCKQRGLLYGSMGRWADARRDFDTMVKYDPKNPDAWFLRAEAELALGDAAAAQADMQQALTLAPEHWTGRPDVVRFMARLNPRRTP
jgi:Tetratricopeptide repeat